METATTVLFIDDSPMDRMMLEGLLSKAGFSVLLAETGEDGLKLAKERKPHVIVLDILLPHISGIELCKRFRNDPLIKDIPVIFYTSLDTPKDFIDYASYGAREYIQKSMPPQALIDAINAVLKPQKTHFA